MAKAGRKKEGGGRGKRWWTVEKVEEVNKNLVQFLHVGVHGISALFCSVSYVHLYLREW